MWIKPLVIRISGRYNTFNLHVQLYTHVISRHLIKSPADYCRGLNNGFYHDPWNPWCGYIECMNDVSYRISCKNHTFIDVMSNLKISQKSLCRKSLDTVIQWKGQCPDFNEGNICIQTAGVEFGNPPYPNVSSYQISLEFETYLGDKTELLIKLFSVYLKLLKTLCYRSLSPFLACSSLDNAFIKCMK